MKIGAMTRSQQSEASSFFRHVIVKMRSFCIGLILMIVMASNNNSNKFIVAGQGVQVENFPLTISSPVNCDEIFETHAFDGTCCSMEVTEGGGCVLTVINGRCIVRGQVWTLDYTSTYTYDTCPSSEYNVLPDENENDDNNNSTLLSNRCGTCWCIPGNNGFDPCPQNTTGIVETFDIPQSETNNLWSSLYSSFALTNDNETFLSLNPENCYPFFDALSGIGGNDNTTNTTANDGVGGYPESFGKVQCNRPSTSTTILDDTVCAFAFIVPAEVDDTDCAGRSYEIRNYESRQAAEDAGAVVTHEGGCGVCSSAQDFAATIDTYGSFEIQTVACVSTYSLNDNENTRFSTLINCFQRMGFTRQCSILWAHSAATSAMNCAESCIADDPETGLATLNGPPPACEKSICSLCSEPWQDDFDILAGRTLPNSGILTERLAISCDDFARIIHDPCTSSSTDKPQPTAIPTEQPTPIQPPRNDRCGISIRLEANVEINGTTANANPDFINQDVCGIESDQRGIWYELVGSGREVTIELCSHNNRQSTFGVFFQCNSELCTGFAPNMSGPNSCANNSNRDEVATYTFQAEFGKSYFVHVREAGNFDGPVNFNLIYTEGNAGEVVVRDTPLSAASPVSCEVIIESSIFEGDCCSLNSTEGGGCVLNVVNGRCIVLGQYWTLDYTSTYSLSICPQGEFEVTPAPSRPPSQPSTPPPSVSPGGEVTRAPSRPPSWPSPPPSSVSPGDCAVALCVVENLPLTTNSPVSCDVIIESSTFDGNCCALNSTAGGGCVLNVVNGRCVIRGQYWTLDYTSTFTLSSCPPGEYNVLEDQDTPAPATTPPPVSAPATPINDRCIGAITLEAGVELLGDTSYANFDYNSQGVCGGRSNERALWYRIIGSSNEITVSVCTNNNFLMDFGVFYRCNDVLCLGHSPSTTTDEIKSCSEGQAVSYQFFTEDDEDYYIHVRSERIDSIGSNFRIVYEEVTTSPTAIPSDVPTTTSTTPPTTTPSSESSSTPTFVPSGAPNDAISMSPTGAPSDDDSACSRLWVASWKMIDACFLLLAFILGCI